MARPKGARSKTTLQRIALAHDALKHGNRTRIDDPHRSAIYVMREVMARFAGQAIEHFNKQQWDNALLYAREAAVVAGKLAPYEAPQLQAVTVTRIDPYQHLSDGELFKELVKRGAAIGLYPRKLPKTVEGRIINEGSGPAGVAAADGDQQAQDEAG